LPAPYNPNAPFMCTNPIKIAISADFGKKTYRKWREQKTASRADFSVLLKTSEALFNDESGSENV
jgi:predicted transcriptional regulator